MPDRRIRIVHHVALVLVLTTRALSAQHGARDGQFKGRSLEWETATPPTVNARQEPVEGVATWRIERDSADWRAKVTVRIALADSAHTVIVIRTGSTDIPAAPMYPTIGANQWRYFFTAKIYERTSVGPRVYSGFASADTIVFTRSGPVRAGETLRATLQLKGGVMLAMPRRPGERALYAMRLLTGDFAATFNPELESPTRVMTNEFQTAIMARALDDFEMRWRLAHERPSPHDSAANNTYARAYLDNRWRDAVAVDSLAVEGDTMYVRLRGRYAPVFCVLSGGVSAPRCRGPIAPPIKVLAGTVRGTHMYQPRARDTTVFRSTPVTGTARWRLELDSLDWRRKVTIRIALGGSEPTRIVIRTALAALPHGMLKVKNIPSSHVDPRYFTASLAVMEKGVWHDWEDHDIAADTITFDSSTVASPTRLLSGVFHLGGFDQFNQRLPLQKRVLSGTFAAAFDVREQRVPATMTPALAEGIMRRAVHEFVTSWINRRLGASDSTVHNETARAFLRSRWDAALIIDSVAAGPRTFFIRLRGRFAPVECVVTERMRGASCADYTRDSPTM